MQQYVVSICDNIELAGMTIQIQEKVIPGQQKMII